VSQGTRRLRPLQDKRSSDQLKPGLGGNPYGKPLRKCPKRRRSLQSRILAISSTRRCSSSAAIGRSNHIKTARSSNLVIRSAIAAGCTVQHIRVQWSAASKIRIR
jgi:hypothetical protein